MIQIPRRHRTGISSRKRCAHPMHLTAEHIVPAIHWETMGDIQGVNSTIQRVATKSVVNGGFNSVAEFKKAVSETVKKIRLTREMNERVVAARWPQRQAQFAEGQYMPGNEYGEQVF